VLGCLLIIWLNFYQVLLPFDERNGMQSLFQNLVLRVFECLLIFIFCNFYQVLLPFDVLLTSYDIALVDQDFLSQIPWQYAIIDEAQRLKNPSSVC